MRLFLFIKISFLSTLVCNQIIASTSQLITQAPGGPPVHQMYDSFGENNQRNLPIMQAEVRTQQHPSPDTKTNYKICASILCCPCMTALVVAGSPIAICHCCCYCLSNPDECCETIENTCNKYCGNEFCQD